MQTTVQTVSIYSCGREPSFQWNADNEDLVVPEQRAIAVYVNGWDQIVMRAERAWDDEADTFLCISRENIPVIIERLQAILAGK